MTLNSNDDVLVQVIESYRGFADTLDGEKKRRFQEMLNLCYQFVEAINAKGEPFPEEAVIMTLLLKQHVIIEELKDALEQNKQRQVK